MDRYKMLLVAGLLLVIIFKNDYQLHMYVVVNVYLFNNHIRPDTIIMHLLLWMEAHHFTRL